MLVFRVLRACKGDGGFIGQLGEARIGVVGFNNSLQETSSGAGRFIRTASMCRRGLERFDFEKLPCGRVFSRQPALHPGLVDEAAPSMLAEVGVLQYMRLSSSVSPACWTLM